MREASQRVAGAAATTTSDVLRHNDYSMAIVEPEMPIPCRTARRVSVFAGCDDFILVDVPFLNTTGRLINISEGGLAVHFAGPVAECATMEVGFSLGGERLTDTCQVIWSMPTSRGMRFLGFSAEQ